MDNSTAPLSPPTLNEAPFFDDSDLSAWDKVKQGFWRLIFPIFPYVRNAALRLHIVKHTVARQDFHIGYLAPDKTAEDLEIHLRSQGFDEDGIAWIDKGESVGLRRRVSFRYQYHLRLFSDGEFRGHYELTPEYNPIGHLAEWEFFERTDEFLEFLDGWVAGE
jgi:hypothetical protein